MTKEKTVPTKHKSVAPGFIIARQTVAMKKAKEIGFIPAMPTYPNPVDKVTGLPRPASEESIRGFMSRFHNWESIVNHRHREFMLAKNKTSVLTESSDFVSLRKKYSKK